MPRTAKKADPSALNKFRTTKSPNNEVVIRSPVKQDETKATNALDLSMFKFEKKPHVKIEFEKDSPEKVEEESKGLWEPANWKEFLINLRNMRSNYDAPVDTMGCHMTMDENAPLKVKRYQSLIALMLSSQTKDQVTFAAMERLRDKGLTVDNVLKMSDEELGKLIYPVGFWKTKVKYIKKTTQTLKEQYDGDIPDSVDKLCKLTGVGPKMAHICMQVAWNKTTGIGVDTHVHRISNRIGWVKKTTATPEDTRKALQSWLPFDLWSEVNHLMVGFGQTICQPVSPLCHECLNRDICPSSGMGRKSPGKKSPMKKIVENDIKEEIKITDETKDIILVSPRNRKNIPTKNDLKTKTKQDEDTLKVEDVPLASRKRKITPKKNVETTNKLEVDTKQEILQSASKPLNIRKGATLKVTGVSDKQENLSAQVNGDQRDKKAVKKSPVKKVKVQEIRKVETNDVNSENDNINVTKNPTIKRLAAAKGKTIHPNSLADDCEVLKNTKITRSKQNIDNVKSTNTGLDSKQVKK